MKELVFHYLNDRFPNAYRVRKHLWWSESFFVLENLDINTLGEAPKTLCSLFSVQLTEAQEITKSWLDSLPTYRKIDTSTNHSVLVPEQTGCYSTIFNTLQ